MQIVWKQLTNFTGRNGYGKCGGVEVMPLVFAGDEKVMLSAMTSKGVVARCDVTIPKESIPAVIAALQTALDELNGKPPVPVAKPLPQTVDEFINGSGMIERGWLGEPAMLDALENLSDASHGPHCSYRCKGECDCGKSVINAILTAFDRETA